MDKHNRYRTKDHDAGRSIVLERQERISIEGNSRLLIKNTQTQVRELYRRDTREQRRSMEPEKSSSLSDGKIIQTRIQVDSLNKQIEHEIGRLKNFRDYFLHAEAPATRAPVQQRQINRTWGQSLGSNNTTTDEGPQDTNRTFSLSNPATPRPERLKPRFRTLGVKAPSKQEKELMDMVETEADVDSEEVSRERIRGGCTFGHDLHAQCSVYQCDYGQSAINPHLMVPPLALPSSYHAPNACPCCECQATSNSSPRSFQYSMGGSPYQQQHHQPTTPSAQHYPNTVNVQSFCVYPPHPNYSRRVTDLNTEDFCRHWCQNMLASRSTSNDRSSRSTATKASTRATSPRSRSVSRSPPGKSKFDYRVKRKLKEAGISDSSSLAHYKVQDHEKIMKITLRKQAQADQKKSSQRSGNNEHMIIKDYVPAKSADSKVSAADKDKVDKARMYKDYMNVYQRENLKALGSDKSPVKIESPNVESTPTYTIIQKKSPQLNRSYGSPKMKSTAQSSQSKSSRDSVKSSRLAQSSRKAEPLPHHGDPKTNSKMDDKSYKGHSESDSAQRSKALPSSIPITRKSGPKPHQGDPKTASKMGDTSYKAHSESNSAQRTKKVSSSPSPSTRRPEPRSQQSDPKTPSRTDNKSNKAYSESDTGQRRKELPSSPTPSALKQENQQLKPKDFAGQRRRSREEVVSKEHNVMQSQRSKDQDNEKKQEAATMEAKPNTDQAPQHLRDEQLRQSLDEVREQKNYIENQEQQATTSDFSKNQSHPKQKPHIPQSASNISLRENQPELSQRSRDTTSNDSLRKTRSPSHPDYSRSKRDKSRESRQQDRQPRSASIGSLEVKHAEPSRKSIDTLSNGSLRKPRSPSNPDYSQSKRDIYDKSHESPQQETQSARDKDSDSGLGRYSDSGSRQPLTLPKTDPSDGIWDSQEGHRLSLPSRLSEKRMQLAEGEVESTTSICHTWSKRMVSIKRSDQDGGPLLRRETQRFNKECVRYITTEIGLDSAAPQTSTKKREFSSHQGTQTLPKLDSNTTMPKKLKERLTQTEIFSHEERPTQTEANMEERRTQTEPDVRHERLTQTEMPLVNDRHERLTQTELHQIPHQVAGPIYLQEDVPQNEPQGQAENTEIREYPLSETHLEALPSSSKNAVKDTGPSSRQNRQIEKPQIHQIPQGNKYQQPSSSHQTLDPSFFNQQANQEPSQHRPSSSYYNLDAAATQKEQKPIGSSQKQDYNGKRSPPCQHSSPSYQSQYEKERDGKHLPYGVHQEVPTQHDLKTRPKELPSQLERQNCNFGNYIADPEEIVGGQYDGEDSESEELAYRQPVLRSQKYSSDQSPPAAAMDRNRIEIDQLNYSYKSDELCEGPLITKSIKRPSVPQSYVNSYEWRGGTTYEKRSNPEELHERCISYSHSVQRFEGPHSSKNSEPCYRYNDDAYNGQTMASNRSEGSAAVNRAPPPSYHQQQQAYNSPQEEITHYYSQYRPPPTPNPTVQECNATFYNDVIPMPISAYTRNNRPQHELAESRRAQVPKDACTNTNAIVANRRTRTVKFNDQNGEIRMKQQDTVEQLRSAIDWERAYQNGLLSPDDECDVIHTCRSSSSNNTEVTCIDSNYEDEYVTCDEDRSEDMFKNIPPFKGCPCMLQTYMNLASIRTEK